MRCLMEAVMQLEFQVMRDGAIVFRRVFPPSNGGLLADLTAVALADLYLKRPDFDLTDNAVTMKWSQKPKDGQYVCGVSVRVVTPLGKYVATITDVQTRSVRVVTKC